jgi:hypothetical protein
MRLVFWISILAVSASVLTTEAQSNQSKVLKRFADAVGTYVQMQQDLDGAVSAQKSTTESEQIADRQHELAGLIADARRSSHQGDIFTEDIAEQFRKIIRKAFQGPDGEAIRKTIKERDPVTRIVLKVNEVYPDDQSRTIMPSSLLNRLPPLAKELEYRIVGHALVLQDTKTNLIVDFIPNAIP